MIKRDIIPLGTGTVKIVEESGTHLGILLSGGKKNYALTQFSQLKQSPGWIVDENSIKPWHVTGVLEHEGNTYFYGPYEDGTTLHEIISNPDPENLHYIKRLAAALLLLEQRSQPFPPVYGNSVLFLNDGRILFLPPEIILRSTPQLSEETRREGVDYMVHPDRKDEEAAVFTCGVIAYRLLTGVFPFTDEHEEVLHIKMRSKSILPPKMVKPEIRKDVSDFIMSNLEAGRPPMLQDWIVEVDRWLEEGTEETVSDEQRALIEAEAAKYEKKSEKSFTTRTFLQKHKVSLTVAAVGTVAAIWFVASMLSNILAPPVTVGMAPREVTRLFYTSMNSLDHITMEDCVAPKVAKNRLNEVMHLYVIGKMRMANEGTSGIINAQQWVENGSPPIGESETIYGITDLQIRAVTETETEARYRVSYKKYAPSQPEGDIGEQPGTSELMEQGPLRIGVMENTEEVFVENTGKYWEIYRIDVIESEELAPIQPARTQGR
jgi:hypothetical protein